MLLPAPIISGALMAALAIGNVSLFMVDHIHFQYNGILLGILLMSVVKMKQEKFLQGAFLFALLLNMKHLFLYVAPAYIVYLLKCYCWRSKTWLGTFVSLLKLGAVVLSVTAVSFGPFYHQSDKLLQRMFPFQRGLCHAYWAPNFWALYNGADFLLAKFLYGHRTMPEYTQGLVQQFDHQVLLSVTPQFTVALTFLAHWPHLIFFWLQKYDRIQTPRSLLRLIAMSACASFLFGWHVHEKAILMALIPIL